MAETLAYILQPTFNQHPHDRNAAGAARDLLSAQHIAQTSGQCLERCRPLVEKERGGGKFPWSQKAAMLCFEQVFTNRFVRGA
jgi:hypothetical protein